MARAPSRPSSPAPISSTTYETFLDDVFSTYGAMYEPINPWFRTRFPKQPEDTDFVYSQTILAKTCDTLRWCCPAGTRSNLGIYATGQSYEQLLMRLAQHPLAEMRAYGELMLIELRKVIPEFLKRVDSARPRGRLERLLARGARADTGADRQARRRRGRPEPRDLGQLVDHDPEGELKITAAVLYEHSHLPDDQLLRIAATLSPDERAGILAASLGERGNRRHKPGRAWERTQYRFDVLCDYGAFRDLQRHRPLTLEWQRLTPSFGYDVPAEIDEAGPARGLGVRDGGARVMTHDADRRAGLPDVAQYAVSMAYRIRFVMQMTAREAMHLTELRSQPAGHPVYRAVAQEMHRAIAAVHPAIAAAFTHISYEDVDLERLEAERRTELKRKAR